MVADGDSPPAMPVHEMSVMIIEEENARMLKKAMNLHSMKLIADTSILTQTPDIGMQSTAPPRRTLAVLGKRHRSPVAQVLVALHRRHAEAGQQCLKRTISANASSPAVRSQLFDELNEHNCEEPIGAATTAQDARQVMQKEQGGGEEEESACKKNDGEERFCTTPTHRRRQQEGLVCPAPPSKPASKPRQPTPPYKKFFVPTNLAELPSCFKSLFT
eukprot:c18090_g3_i1 orf=130-780(+)